MKKIAINGLGRIGRLVLRRYMDVKPENVELVAMNDLTSSEDMAYLIKYDSVHGQARFPVEAGEDALILDGRTIPFFSEKDPSKLPWKELEVDVVLECTGFFTKREKAMAHITAGARRVIISAPSPDPDIMIVLGVNQDQYDPARHMIVSNASCTTNSLGPVTRVLDEAFGIDSLLGTTIHAYTSSQAIVDSPVGKGRKGRAAALSLVPATTGAAKAMIPLFPDLDGRMDMIAVRVPVPDGSLSDITMVFKRDVSVESINAALKKAAEGEYKGIIAYNDEEIVSSDIIGNSHSGVVDAPSTKVIVDRIAKVMVWYDNEYGYASRMLDLAQFMANRAAKA
ncbi:MAG: type I glyceraldehyde-3-phosphate dehydrogenase [Synergistaceae bacterium]|nr:type I glyceraldehyde-3-phosphate dehydrogenase [Synergistaceae bacterium]